MGAPRRLYRLSYDRMLGGVCSGMAKYMDVDVTLIRVLVITLFFFSGGLLLLGYIAAWIMLPLDRGIEMPAPAAQPAAQ